MKKIFSSEEGKCPQRGGAVAMLGDLRTLCSHLVRPGAVHGPSKMGQWGEEGGGVMVTPANVGVFILGLASQAPGRPSPAPSLA